MAARGQRAIVSGSSRPRTSTRPFGRRLTLGLLAAGQLAFASPLAAQVQISGLTDLHFGSWSGVGDVEGSADHCVSGSRGARYAVVATGTGPGGVFALDNGAATIPFLVDYDSGDGWNPLQAGVPLGGQKGSPNPQQFERCLDGRRTPERVRVRILEQDLGAAPGGSYTGRLTLLVVPE